MDCFALLDDRDSTPERRTSRLYSEFVREHRCTEPLWLERMWAQVDADLRDGLHALVLIDYEWGAKLLRAGHERLGENDPAALRVLMFRDLVHLSGAQVQAWLDDRLEGEGGSAVANAAGVMNLSPSVDRAEFTNAITRIHEAIRAGETYQVNYTYRLQGQAYGSPLRLYARLRQRQPVSYGALIALPDRDGAIEYVLSRSPELFLRHTDGVLEARPMKGTAPRIPAPESDSETARLLSLDIKNRAENLMIVDLLRNDLGRVAQIGSVKVPSLFDIEPYATLFQMTSTVQARLRPELAFPAVLHAVFPCGSITGAPKHHTMELIAGLESTPRGLYCGSIGWMDAPRGGARCGDFCLSVAIRTVTLGHEAQGLRPVRLGVGAGIVLDSQADDEFEECRIKARFLTELDVGFRLFETMLATSPHGGSPVVRHLERHLDRMARSARILGFRFDRRAAFEEATACAAALACGAEFRVRLELAHDGRRELTHSSLRGLPDACVNVCIANVRLPDVNPLAGHKTTLRRTYDEGVRAAERVGAFDSLFFTEDGRLVEGGRSSVFLRIDGRWYTPPLGDGALAGVMRGLLLEDPAWSASERTLGLEDLLHADGIVVCNALRGALPARLVEHAIAAA